MGGLELLATAVGVGLIVRLGLLERDRSRMQRLSKRLASSFGIEIERTPSLFDRGMEGSVRGHRISLISPSINYVRIEIKPARRIPPAVRIASRWVGEGGQRTGDEELDLRFVALGPPLQVAAVLGAEARRVLKSIRESRVIVAGGGILLDGFWGELSEHDLERLIDENVTRALELAELLPIEEVEVLPRILEHVEHDPDRGVRLENLLLLLSSDRPDLAKCALEAALTDEDAGMRMIAATRSERAVAESDALAAVASWDRIDIVSLALSTLKHVGTLRAIEALRSRERALVGVSRLLRDTIAAIQARCGTAGEGHLSIAEEHGGHVSLTGGGDLSLPDRDR